MKEVREDSSCCTAALEDEAMSQDTRPPARAGRIKDTSSFPGAAGETGTCSAFRGPAGVVLPNVMP